LERENFPLKNPQLKIYWQTVFFRSNLLKIKSENFRQYLKYRKCYWDFKETKLSVFFEISIRYKEI
jgi:hypothetical protein